MTKYLALVVALAACKKGDDCARLFDRMASIMKNDKVASARDGFLADCRKDPKYLADPGAKCILEASSDSVAADCMKKDFEAYASKSKASEAALQLNKLGKRAKMVFGETSSFPSGKAKMLPDVPTCCSGEGGKCAVSTAWASDPVWKALDFSIDEPSMYRYSYESDGKTFTALAVGDTDCDGTFATFTLAGTIDAAGNPSVNLTKPGAGQY